MGDEKRTGWITLHRKVMASNVYDNGQVFNDRSAWIDLLLLANFKDGNITVNTKRIDIKRGQVGYSQTSLATRWQWSRGKVKRYLNWLESEHQIELVNVQADKRLKSIITITNYDYYQQDEPNNEPNNEPQTDRRQTEDGTVSNNDNNENNNNASKSSPSKTAKKTRKKVRPVRDNPPSYEEILEWLNKEGSFNNQYLDPLALYHSYFTDKPEGQEWTYANGKDIMNWKSLFRNIHDKNQREGKIVGNNNYVQDQTKLVPVHLQPRNPNNHPDDPIDRNEHFMPVEQVVWNNDNPERKRVYVRRGDDWYDEVDNLIEAYFYGDEGDPHYDCIKNAPPKT